MKRKAKILILLGLVSIAVLGLLYWRFFTPEPSLAAQRPPSVVQQATGSRFVAGANVVLRPNEEWCWRELCVTVTKIVGNPTNADKRSVDLNLSIPNLRPEIDQLTLTNGATIFFGPYGITVEDVNPRSEGGPRRGTAKFFIWLVVTPTPDVSRQHKSPRRTILQTTRIRVGEERSFVNLNVMLTKTGANPTDADEDLAYLNVSIPTLSPQIDQLTLSEGETVSYGLYKITAEEVQVRSEGDTRRGTARFLIRRVVTPTPAKDPIS